MSSRSKLLDVLCLIFIKLRFLKQWTCPNSKMEEFMLDIKE